MSLQVLTTETLDPEISTVVDFLFDDFSSASSVSSVDREALERLGFKGKVGEVQRSGRADGLTIVVGLGRRDDLDAEVVRRAAGLAVRAVFRSERVAFLLPVESQAAAEGVILGSYSFRSHKSAPETVALGCVEVVGADAPQLLAGVRLAEATNLARDLIIEPPSSMTPTILANAAVEVANANGLSVEVWDEQRIAAERMGGILGVSSGSDEPPRFVELVYEPTAATAGNAVKTVVVAGKGITFDSGGLSLKPSDSMAEMKTDMAGAAATLAAMSTLSHFRPDVRVVAYLACSENLPGPKAAKPGDVLTARNGKTMEVLNTDAEGRLVLADALSLAVEQQPDAIIDIATLTGACKVALGNDVAGIFGNDDSLIATAKKSASRTGENIWHLPLHTKYAKLIESNVADIKNQASPGGGGLITSAFFLKEFVGDIPWIHLDIAGTARGDGDDALSVKGGTGWGVRLLVDILRTYE